MVVTIHQPDFLPWLGFFDRWRRSDLFIVLDDVQFIRRGWHHRDRIKTHNGVQWLTVSIVKKGRYFQQIREVALNNTTHWKSKHLGMIESAYKKAPSFERCFNSIQEIYQKEHYLLIDLNLDLLNYFAGELGITTPILFSSDLHVKSDSTQRLVDLVKSINGSTYLTGLGAVDYLDESLFQKEKIMVSWQEFTHPVYRQLHGEFVPTLSTLDYLMMQ